MLGLVGLLVLTLAAAPDAATGSTGPPDGGVPDARPPADASFSADAGAGAGLAKAEVQPPVSLGPLPPVREATAPPGASSAEAGTVAAVVPAKRRSASGKGKQRGVSDPVATGSWRSEAQNQLQAVARRYAQLLSSRRFDEARLMHEEEGGRRPDWTNLRATADAFLEAHGRPRVIEQNLVTYVGSELTTFYFTALFSDHSELPIRVAVDHWGHVSGAGVGSEVVPATRKRYDRNDQYKTRTPLSLPFAGVWTASNATLAPGNGHYLNANQRFAVDFFITEDAQDGKRKSHRDSGKQNIDYFAYGQDVLAPADAVVVQVVDGVPDNPPGLTDVYYRLGNSVILSFENGEYAHLCHLMPGSMRVRPGDHVQRGQVLAKCGNSGNSTGPHLHFQLTDGPQISHAASLPAYFRNVRKNGAAAAEVLPQSGDRLENAPNRDRGRQRESSLGTNCSPGSSMQDESCRPSFRARRNATWSPNPT